MDDSEKEISLNIVWAIALIVILMASFLLLNELNANWVFKKCIETSTQPTICLQARYGTREE